MIRYPPYLKPFEREIFGVESALNTKPLVTEEVGAKFALKYKT